jgi:zinc transporter 9
VAASSSGAVFLALVGNLILTVIKSAAFLVSGSGAMLSEAIHSFADTGNQGLLYLGIRRSSRPADSMFHYGYGGERFLFALLSAVGIFVLGCGVTIYHGIQNLIHPPELKLDWLTFTVLGIAFLVDGYVLRAAVRAVAARKGETGFWHFARRSSDPTILAVLFEDAVACLGVVVATVGILLTYWTGNPMFDAISAIIIGLMLGAIAVWLGYRNRQLLLGPAIPPEIEDAVIEHILSQPSVHEVRDIKSRVVAANLFKLKAEVDYDGRFLARQHVGWVKDRLTQLGDDAAVEDFVTEFGERMLDSLGREVDRIEASVVAKFPRLRHLDLESDWRVGD